MQQYNRTLYLNGAAFRAAILSLKLFYLWVLQTIASTRNKDFQDVDGKSPHQDWFNNIFHTVWTVDIHWVSRGAGSPLPSATSSISLSASMEQARNQGFVEKDGKSPNYDQ